MTDNSHHDSTPEIDFEHLNRYVDGDAALTRELFGLFQNQTEMWMKMLTLESSPEMFESAAHSLKGTAQAVGAMRLAGLCQQAEDFGAMKGTKGRKAQLIQDIEFTVSRIIAEMQRWEHRQMIKDLDK
jgi:HPt (histidine-containing phosphotransfer) domain-containing protein